MSRSPGESLPDQIEAESIIDQSGTIKLKDQYAPLQSGNSVGPACPQPFADMLGIPDVDSHQAWVNLEEGWYVAKFPGYGDDVDHDEVGVNSDGGD